ncbi:MAG: hypothetical protein CMJ79_14870 [Planctomycetaceae bacterium]|nr:hypothetical protein [Planctomycetaceae bacterium]|tara:strand:+ start:506 stop:730 length:225 start_codon:yes stop_codon:yes gene_type:complete
MESYSHVEIKICVEPIVVKSDLACVLVGLGKTKLNEYADAGLIPRVRYGTAVGYRIVDLHQFAEDCLCISGGVV